MYFLPYSPVESHPSTPSDIFQEFVDPSELQELWSGPTFAMADQIYADQFGRLTASMQEWTPASAVSSFNLPLIYDSTLTTPVSPNNPDLSNAHGKHLNDAPWSRQEHPPMQYPLRSNDGIYTSVSMKSKNDPLSQAPSDPENMLSISPYVFDSPSTPCPPTPYWGSFSVSAPPTTNASTGVPTPSSTPRTDAGAQAGSQSQAPILTAPTPGNRRSRQPSQDDHSRKQKRHGHPSQVGLGVHHQQQKAQSSVTQVKRECSSPVPESKRRRRSVPPEQRKPLSKDELSDEDKLLLHLRDIKEDEKWDWKELTERFNKETGGKHNLAALQMRHTRLVERMRVWTDVEIRALNRAKVQFENQKWKTIAECMLEYGCETKWSPHACQQKWQELHPNDGGEYDAGSVGAWNENATVGTASPYVKDASISRGEDMDDERDEERIGEQHQLLHQQQHFQMQQGGGRSGGASGRLLGAKNVYGQRQEWTVQHSDPHLTSRSVR